MELMEASDRSKHTKLYIVNSTRVFFSALVILYEFQAVRDRRSLVRVFTIAINHNERLRMQHRSLKPPLPLQLFDNPFIHQSAPEKAKQKK